MAAIAAKDLVKEYPGGVRGVDTIDLDIKDGEFFALLGPSGCGKTTLLRSIAGLEAITSGTLSIGQRDVTHAEPGARGVAMVFQDYALFPHMDVGDNIAYPMRIRGVAKPERRATAETVANGLSLNGLIERRPSQLSGGQQQRVALARAVSIQPDVLLLDEPLSNLDARLRLEARTFLKELQRDLGVTTVFVTHDQAEALALADRIAVMKAGKLEQIGTPREIFHRPDTTFVAGFIGSVPMNLITATIEGSHVRVGETTIPLPENTRDLVTNGQKVVWGIRPEYVKWSTSPTADAIPGEIVVTETLGATSLLLVDIGGHKIQIVVPEDQEPALGEKGWVVPQLTHCLVFDAQSEERIGE